MEKDTKRNNEPRSTSTVWVALLIVGTLAVCLFLILSQSTHKLRFSEFQELIAATQYEAGERGKLVEGSTGEIEVPGVGTRSTLIYSSPNDIVIGPTLIEGKCFIREPGKSDTSARAVRSFTVNKDASEKTNELLRQQLTESNILWRFGDGPTWLERYGMTLFFIAAMLGLFYYMIRRMSGSGGPMQFGRSRGKLCAEEDLGVSFSDVAGIDEAVEEVKEVVDFLNNAEKYQKLGGKIPCGVLLVGPPGTGKTLLAKAIAGEAGVPFFSLSGSDFVEMFVGVGAARVRDMFQQAQAKAPCIIFIDELDALGKTRGNGSPGGHDEREQTLNALLVEMDGFASNSGVIVMAATNRPETLDQALMRPGRFDRHVLVDRPDVRGREAILKVHVKNVKLDPNVDLDKIAAISPGFGGAELANLVNEAALLAARLGQSTVVMENFNEAVERVTAGLEKKQRVMQPDEKQRVAYHEAGHALVAFVLPNTDPVHKVSIIPRGLAALGYTMQRPTKDKFLMTKSELESELQILLAGTLAEEMIYTDISTGASNDLERATDIARSMVMQYGMSSLGRVNFKQDRSSPFLAGASNGNLSGRLYSEQTAREIDEEVNGIINLALTRVRKILHDRRDALVALTDRLIEIESVDSVELKTLVDEHSPGPRLVPGTDSAPIQRTEPEAEDDGKGIDAVI